MINLTRYDGTKFVLNCEIIQYVEATPDTIITLTTGDKLMVKENVDNVIKQVIDFKKQILTGMLELKRNEDIKYLEE